MNKVLLSVDVSNLFYTLRSKFSNGKLDYKHLLNHCKQRGQIYRAIAYASDMNGKAEDFFNCIRMIGYEVKIKQVKQFVANGITKQKANWDVGIAIDIARYITHFDELILVSSDSDMAPVVEFCKERGCKVHVLSCIISNELRACADTCEEIVPAFLEKTSASQNNTPTKTTE